MTDIFIRRPCEHIQSGYMHRGRQPHEDRGRVWSYAATTQGAPGLLATTKDRTDTWSVFSSEHGPAITLTSNF